MNQKNMIFLVRRDVTYQYFMYMNHLYRTKRVREHSRTKFQNTTAYNSAYFLFRYISPETPKNNSLFGTPDGYVQKIVVHLKSTWPAYKKLLAYSFFGTPVGTYDIAYKKNTVFFGTCTKFLVHTRFAVHLRSKIL